VTIFVNIPEKRQRFSSGNGKKPVEISRNMILDLQFLTYYATNDLRIVIISLLVAIEEKVEDNGKWNTLHRSYTVGPLSDHAARRMGNMHQKPYAAIKRNDPLTPILRTECEVQLTVCWRFATLMVSSLACGCSRISSRI